MIFCADYRFLICIEIELLDALAQIIISILDNRIASVNTGCQMSTDIVKTGFYFFTILVYMADGMIPMLLPNCRLFLFIVIFIPML